MREQQLTPGRLTITPRGQSVRKPGAAWRCRPPFIDLESVEWRSGHVGCSGRLRYPDGGGLRDADRARREQVRLRGTPSAGSGIGPGAGEAGCSPRLPRPPRQFAVPASEDQAGPALADLVAQVVAGQRRCHPRQINDQERGLAPLAAFTTTLAN